MSTATVDQVWFDGQHVGADDESVQGANESVPLEHAAAIALRLLDAGASVQVTWLGGSAQSEWMTTPADVEAFADEVAAFLRGGEE